VFASSLSVLGVLVVASASAQAHFKLNEPVEALLTNATGNPSMGGVANAGNQKDPPCGTGDASGMITKVTAGSTLHVKITETVGHGGHYRVSIVNKFPAVAGDFTDPVVTGTCGSAAIMATPVLPVLADGIFAHTQAQATVPKVYEQDVKLPAGMKGKATLQVIQFMTPHAAPCFYYHCAQLELVDADAGAPDGGVIVVGPDGGVVADSGASSSGSSGTGGSSGSSGSVGPETGSGKLPQNNDSGCSTAAGGAAPSLAMMGVVGVAIASMLRRRRR
jgi:MYXO-CTERM domain-containing protein